MSLPGTGETEALFAKPTPARTATPASTTADRPVDAALHWQVEAVVAEPGLAALEPEWNELSEHAGSALLFNSADWAAACWRHFHARRQGARLWVLAVRSGAELRALLPLWIEPSRSFGIAVRTARLLGEGPSDYGDLLCLEAGGQAIDALAAYLLDHQGQWDLLDLRETPPDSALRSLLVPRLRAQGCSVHEGDDSACRSIPATDPWESYYARHFNSKRRRDHRRDRRILDATGSVTQEWLADEAPVASLAERFATVQAAHAMAGEHRPGEFNDPLFRPFIEDIMAVAARRGWLRLAVMHRDDEILSYYVAFHYRGRYCIYNTAHRADAQQYGVGKLLMLFLLERCFKEGGGLVDFMRGDEPYKETWTEVCRVNRRIQVTGAAAGARMRVWLALRAGPAVARRAPRMNRLLCVLAEHGWRGLVERVGRRIGVLKPPRR